jgi:ABC-2 type transport system ATP-binding protein
MSVTVTGLTKFYGGQAAVNDISFEARPGEVLGFLGPNGAGKSTTMKIITGYIPNTSGRVEVCGQDVEKNSMAVRRKVGYLPENNPLYRDMYVREYLAFMAGLHKIGNPAHRIGELIALTGLEREQHKLIGALSKGYRQRVGLAQAMLHDPPVLILDEPTSGLDPNQLVEIRNLIKSLGKEKTVIFSTHIMQEVQMLCDRVIIINKGRIVADDPIAGLQARLAGGWTVTVEFAEKIQKAALAAVKGITRVEAAGNNRWRLTAEAGADPRPALFRYAVDQNLTLLEMHKETASIEDVFRQLTR